MLGTDVVEASQNESDIMCCICYKTENLYQAKCSHIACLKCWTDWLETALECPTCRQRTRKNQIFPLKVEDPIADID
jgi:hypothetical protein